MWAAKWWHSSDVRQHNTAFPPQSAVFFQQLSETTNQTGFHEQAAITLSGMNVADRDELHSSLRSCFDLAVHVSPLILLGTVPATFSMVRPKLIQVSSLLTVIQRVHAKLTFSQCGQDLGPKPDYVVDAEKAIWAVIMGIAMGQDSSELLAWFVQSSSAQFDNLQANADNVGKYFVNGYLDTKADVDADEDMPMSMDHATTQTSSAMDIDPVAQNHQSAPPVGPSSPPAKPFDATTGGTEMDLLMDITEPQYSSSPPPTGPSSPPHTELLSMSPGRDAGDHVGSTSSVHDVNAIYGGGGSRLSSLTSLASTDSEDEAIAATAQPAPPPAEVRSSGRIVIPAGKFTSGASLTQPSAPASKKRKLESQAPTSGEAPTSGQKTISMKEQDLYWTSTLAYVTAAVSLLLHSSSYITTAHGTPRLLMSLRATLPPPGRRKKQARLRRSRQRHVFLLVCRLPTDHHTAIHRKRDHSVL